MNIQQNTDAVLIAGTSTGIGKATVLHLDRLGFRVSATVRNKREAQALHGRWRHTASTIQILF